jgi:hypothetical protein
MNDTCRGYTQSFPASPGKKHRSGLMPVRQGEDEPSFSIFALMASDSTKRGTKVLFGSNRRQKDVGVRGRRGSNAWIDFAVIWKGLLVE